MGLEIKKILDLGARGYLKSNQLRSKYVRVSPNLKTITNSKDTWENLEKCLDKFFDCFLFVTEATHWCVKTGSEQGSYANLLCQVTAVTAESFLAPVLDVFLTPLHGLKSQHVMQDKVLEFGPPSGTGKLIPLLLDAGTSRCTRIPPPTDGIYPHLAHSLTCVTAQVWPMS